MANALVFNKIKKQIGFDKCKVFLTGAAPLSNRLQEFFLGIGMPLFEAYGMSETCGAITVNIIGNYKLGTVGIKLPNTIININNPDMNGDGEICFSGRTNFMGYLKNEEETKSTYDNNGLLHSGDLGTIDKSGFLKITGRIKELLITAGGENIAPVLIEDVLNEALKEIVSYSIVIGDGKKYLSAIFTLKSEMSDGLPTKRLALPVIEFLKGLGIKKTEVSDVTNDPALLSYFDKQIAMANKKLISNAHSVKKFVILPNDFTIESGEFTPTMKFKRKFITNK